ncbi:MAG: hypothetical protein QNJ38_12730 [Prochloraceae cyanobacterium]|nr:hypothetical protein [Prochloraceae cyanobacterium]
MLVILTEEQIIGCERVCQGCVLADRSGSPRWSQGKLSCGRSVGKSKENQLDLYQCQMGFRLAKID